MRLAPHLLAGALSLAAVLTAENGFGQQLPDQPAPAVVVTPARIENVAPVSSFIGHVRAIQSVQIVPRVTAFIEDEPVPQGSNVKAGQVVFVLQKAQYEAAVQSAEAKLASANAALANAQRQYARAAQLASRGYEATANLDVARANRDQAQADVLGAQAASTEAQLDLGYTTITSPIAGRLGAFTLTKGNLVTPATPALATVNQMDPIRIVFSVSDRRFVDFKQRVGSEVKQATSDLALRIELANGKEYDRPGRIAFIDNEADPQTGTIAVYADFPNPEGLLLPGSYVNVNIRRAQPEEAVLAPIAAIQTEQSGNYVLVVGPDHKVEQRPVQLGRQIGQEYVVSKGLAAGENVIVQGVQKVRPGQVVNPQMARPGEAPSGKNPAQTAVNAG
ncbi:MAG: efflux RND transporter periplasmic adaptor subunit [Alphaproteobacteria bacterium]